MLTHVQNHPLLSGLRTAVEEAEIAYKEAHEAGQDLVGYNPAISVAKWARHIEAAGDDRVKLAAVKDERFEVVLAFESRATNYHLRQLTLENRFAALRDYLRNSGKMVKQLNHKSVDNWIRPMLVRTYIAGGALLESTIPAAEHLPHEYSDRACRQRQLGIIKKAFDALKAGLKRTARCEGGPLFIGHSFANLYPTDFVAPRGQKEVKEEGRRLRNIKFLTLDDIERQALLQLSDAISEAEEGEQLAGKALHRVKERENGSINEYQYASRLTAMLDDGDLDGKVTYQHKAQHEKRVAFECSRQLLFATIVEAELARQRLTDLLYLAIDETDALLGLTHKSTDQFRFDKRISMQRAAMLNCLHADVVIRTLGRALKETHDKAQFDYSYGSGALAAEEQLDHCIAKVSVKTEEEEEEEEE